MIVKKFSGEAVSFDPEILKISISKSGATSEQVEQVFNTISPQIVDGMTTRALYELAFDALKVIKKSFAARYSLKKAMRDLGPEGFYFEEWITKLFRQIGYQSISGQTLQGDAVTHEIDVLAVKGDEMHLCECKFRNDIDAKISVTTPMYYLSRFNDLKNNTYTFFGKELKPHKCWLVTNAYLTTDSIKFAEHYNIGIISWDYPVNSSIKYQVDSTAFYPITCLTTLSDENKKFLLSKDVTLVKEIFENPKKLEHLKFSAEQISEILEEAKELIDL
ncbi:MAG: restriction endonuclease [Flavobacterium sp.]|nr:restriction endonuclease [Candidatus Neoflavobacterium equi]